MRLDELTAELGERRDNSAKAVPHLWLEAGATEVLAHGDPHAAEVLGRLPVTITPACARHCVWVARVRSGEDGEHCGRIGHGARHRARHAEKEPPREAGFARN